MNFAAFDLNLLRVFDALMRERSVTRAGEQIGLSQPAVSSALNRLRAILDDQLLVRRGSEMVPTPRAEALAPAVREALAQVEKALAGDRVFEVAKAERTFTLLGSDFFADLLMPRLASRVSMQAPGVRLRLVDSSFGDVDRLLQDDVIDLALERPLNVSDWISSEPLFESDFVVVAAKSEPALASVAPGREIPVELYCSLRHAIRSTDGSLSGVIDEALASKGFARRVVLGLANFHSVALAVARGGLVAALPRQYFNFVGVAMGLAAFELPLESPRPVISAYWHSRHDKNPAHAWLRGLASELSREIGAL